MENQDPLVTGDLAALHTCRAQLDLLLSHAPLGTWTTDRELKVTHAAGAALDRAGFDPRSLTGYTLPRLTAIHAAGTAQAGPLLDAHRQALLGAVTSLTVDWDGRAYQVRVEPLRDATGEIAGCMGLAVEIDRHTDGQAGQTQPDGYPLSLEQAYEELQVQNEELAAQQEELTTQQEELRAVNEALLEAQAQTEAERQRYQALFDFAPDAYLVTGPNGVIREANRAAAALLCAAPGTRLSACLADENQEAFDRHLARLRAGIDDRVQMWDVRLRAGEGQPVTVAITAAAERDKKGNLIAVRWMLRDISERTRMIARLDFQARALDQVGDAVIAIDNEQRVTYLNRQAATQYGLDPQAALGQPLDQLYHFEWPNPEDEAASYAALAGHGHWHGENLHITRSGKRLYVDSTVTVLHNQDGQAQGMVATIRDVSERVATRQALEAERARLAAVVAHAPEGIVVADAEARIILTNPTAEQLYNRPVPYKQPYESHGELQLVYLDGTVYDPRDLPLTRAALDGETAEEVEMAILWPDGQRRELLVNAAPVRDPGDGILGAVGMFQDVTARKRAEEALQWSARRDKVLSETAARLLHSADPQGLVEELCREVMDLLDCQFFFNFIVDEQAGRLHLNAYAGIPEKEAQQIEWLDYGQAVCGCVARDAARIIAEDIGHAPDPRTDLIESYGVRAYCCHPLQVQERLIGTLSFGTRTRAQFSPEQIEVMSTVADLVAIAMYRVETETALRESAELLRQRFEEVETLMKVAPVAIWVSSDPRCDHIVGNPMADRFYEAAEEENVSANVSQRRRFFRHGRELAPEELPMQEAAARNIDIRNDELDVLLPSGRWLNMLGSASPLRDTQGQVRGAVGAFMDITERRQAEEQVRRYVDRLHVLHEMDRAVLAATTAPEMTHSVLSQLPQLVPCVHASAVLCDLPEHKMTLLAVHAAGETAPGNWHGPIDPAWEDIFVRLARGEAYIVPDLQAESPLSPRIERLRAQGVRAHVYLPLLVQDRLIGSLDVGLPTPAPVPEEQIEILHEMADQFAVGVEQARLYAEIERYAGDLERMVRRRTHDLEISEARFRAVFEEAGLGIMLLNRKGRITNSNPALQRILGRSAEDLHGQNLVDLIHPDEAAEATRRLEQLAAGEQSAYRAECRFPRSGRSMVEASVTFSRVQPAKSRSRFVVGLVEDITERRRTQQALIQSDRLAITGRLAASLAHEIGNPLQSVVGCLELIREGSSDGDDPAEYLGVAMDELDRATRILNQMRSLNRRSGGERELANLNDILEKTLLVSRKQCQNQRVMVTRQIDENLPALAVVSDHIQSVFLNMVINAVDAMPQGGELRVGTALTRSPRGIAITFADTGVGIPAEHMANIFEPFQTTKEQGLGLGLYISRQIVEEHGGRIEVESQEGEGTTFTIWLPG